MRWNNIGHEYDGFVKKFELSDSIRFCIYGAGNIGRRVYSIICKFEKNCIFIDNNMKKINPFEITCIPLSEYVYQKGDIIIISVGEKYFGEIKASLANRGYIENENYFFWDYFLTKIFPILASYKYDKCFVYASQISLTERCSLNCKNCCHGCNYVLKNDLQKDLSFEQIKYSIDSFFSCIDYVNDFSILGGEPLLSACLLDTINYIGRTYTERMNILTITTNGTIIPGEDIIEACNIYNVMFRISNYSHIEMIGKRQELLIDVLRKNNVLFEIEGEGDWWYYFDLKHLLHDENKAVQVFSSCNAGCNEIRLDRLYYCIMARSMDENYMNLHCNDGYIELSCDTDKKKIVEFLNGYCNKGYLEMCRYCNGMTENVSMIPAAEQG